MSIRKFKANLAAYGPSLSDWPESERKAALTLLAKSDYAREIHQLEALLKKELGDEKITAPRGLADRIVARAVRDTSEKSTS